MTALDDTLALLTPQTGAYLWYLLVTTIIASSLGWIIYTRFLHPLAGVPGPLAASITRLWYVQKVREGAFNKINRDLHARYGPLVRIAPNEVSVSDPEAVSLIYTIKSARLFTKTDFYPAWAPQGIPTKHANFFTDMDEKHHSSRRKLVSNAYSMRSILESEPYIDSNTELFMTRLSAFATSGEAIDLGAWLQWYAFDVLGDLFFGKPFGFLETSSDYGNWIAALDRMIPVLCTMGVLPASYRTPYILIGTLWKSLRQALRDLGQLTVLAKRLVREREEQGGRSRRRDVLEKLFEVRREKGEREDFGVGDVVMESYVNLFAGSDTTAIAMQSLIYHLLTHPEKYIKLLHELDTAALPTPIKYADSITHLPYFSACAKETMRLHPSVGLQMPRHPPPEGALISGYFFPQSSRVGINPAVLHFDKSVFGEDAEEFRPERWIESSKEHISNMDRHLLTFGRGTRTCIGKNISLSEIHKMLPQMLMRFKLELVHPKRELVKKDWWFFKMDGLDVRVSER